MKIPIRKIFPLLISITFILIAIHTFFILFHYDDIQNNDLFFLVFSRLDLDGEANIPSWYSTIILFSISTASFIIARIVGKFQNHPSLHEKFWLLFGGLFCFLSMDEMARIHEFIDEITNFQFKWVYFYAPFAVIFLALCIYYFFFIRRDNPALQNWIIGGLITYIFGGLFLESLDFFFTLSFSLRNVERVVEEAFEFIGSILILMGCFYEINNLLDKVKHKNV